MTIRNGTRLGHYEVLSAIGASGMEEVYQAHDTKLGRDVAIKVLPETFAHDPERLSRFQREAKMLASLSDSPPLLRRWPRMLDLSPRCPYTLEILESSHRGARRTWPSAPRTSGPWPLLCPDTIPA